MVNSAWASELVEDQSQHRYMDGYARRDMNSVNNVNTMNTANNMTYMNTAVNGKKSNFHASPADPPTPTYPKAFQSGDIDSSSTFGNPNATNNPINMHATKNGKKGNYPSLTTAPRIPAYPSAFQSGEIDSGSTRTNAMNSVGDMNSMNSVISGKSGKKGKYPSPTAVPAIAGYPSTFQSNDIDSSFTPSNGSNTNGMNRVNNIDMAKNAKKSNYHSPTAAPATAGYPSAFDSGENDSSFTSNNTRITNGMNRGNNNDTAKNGKKSNYSSHTVAPAVGGYPSDFQSNEIGSSFPPIIPSNTNTMNRVNNIDTAKTAKQGSYHSPTEAPAIPGYPNAFQASETNLSSTRNRTNTLNNVNSMSTAKNGKKGNCHQPTAASATPAYPSAFQSSDIGRSSNAIAAEWEEHVDEITNRKYFFNSITGRSTWGEPNATVKKPPPPPPIALIVEKREQDHWFKIAGKRGRKMWYNDITQMSQVDRPDCLRKYK